MPDTNDFDLASAVRAGAENRLAIWVGEFLASPGSDNAVLAAVLAQRELWWLGPVRLELARLTPMAGPDEDKVVVPIEKDEWEDDIGEMGHALDEGWEPPPLLVSHRDGGLFLEDGNHRHETLRRAGETHGWAVVWFECEADRARFAESFEDDHPPTHPSEPAQLAQEQLDQVADTSSHPSGRN